MNFKETEQEIHDLQARVKVLSTKRDGIIRQAGSEEQKLQEAYARLRELGVENPEKLSTDALEGLAGSLQTQLGVAVAELTAKVEEGERLLSQ